MADPGHGGELGQQGPPVPSHSHQPGLWWTDSRRCCRKHRPPGSGAPTLLSLPRPRGPRSPHSGLIICKMGVVIVVPRMQLSRGASELIYMESSRAASGTWWVPRASQQASSRRVWNLAWYPDIERVPCGPWGPSGGLPKPAEDTDSAGQTRSLLHSKATEAAAFSRRGRRGPAGAPTEEARGPVGEPEGVGL